MSKFYRHKKVRFYVHTTNVPTMHWHVYGWDEEQLISRLVATFSTESDKFGLKAYVEAQELCDRLNAEYRKEQSND